NPEAVYCGTRHLRASHQPAPRQAGHKQAHGCCARGGAPLSDAAMAQKPSPESADLADLARLVDRMRAGERRAISRAVTELERFSAAAPGLLEAMRPHLGHAVVIGVTGPPGAGKSTLLNAYTRHLRQSGESVGIIAVDPSSPISGGAILGDRIRMTAALDDDGVFMRSLASR